MAEPLSVASGVAGIVSLGLTACQGLLNFYNFYKAYDNDIRNTTSKIQSLTNMLEALERLVKDDGFNNAETGSYMMLVTDSIVSCRHGMRKLDEVLDKCNRNNPCGVSKDNWFRTKMIYPFRQNTLMTLNNTIAGLQHNLDTALGM
jgi:hypothetical protein